MYLYALNQTVILYHTCIPFHFYYRETMAKCLPLVKILLLIFTTIFVVSWFDIKEKYQTKKSYVMLCLNIISGKLMTLHKYRHTQETWETPFLKCISLWVMFTHWLSVGSDVRSIASVLSFTGIWSSNSSSRNMDKDKPRDFQPGPGSESRRWWAYYRNNHMVIHRIGNICVRCRCGWLHWNNPRIKDHVGICKFALNFDYWLELDVKQPPYETAIWVWGYH